MAQAATILNKPKRQATAPRPEPLYLVTGQGVEIPLGKEGDWVRQKISEDTTNDRLAYRHFDDDRRVWATWAVVEPDGKTVKPLRFPDPSQYGMTPPELFTKAVTYPSLLGRAVTLLRQEKQSLWDKMMKPATVIIAIVAIVLIMGMIIMAAQG